MSHLICLKSVARSLALTSALLLTPAFISLSVASTVIAPPPAHPALPRTLSTSGQGVVSAPADMAQISMQASSTAKTANAAKLEADQQVNNLIHKLTTLKIAKDQIIASHLRIEPRYDYQNRQRIFTGYHATRNIVVTLHNLAQLNPVLEVATLVNIQQIQHIQLKSSKEQQLRQQALDSAIADSKAKAKNLAAAYGATLGAIKTIAYQSHLPQPQPKAEFAQMRLSSDSNGGGGGQYIHDDIVFRDQIQVVFELQ